jgi:hypothetical protein
MEVFTPRGEWVKFASLMPGVKAGSRAARDGFDTHLRREAARAAQEWSERKLNGLQDAADRLSVNYSAARRRWIAKLMKARETGQEAPGGEE